MVEGKVEVKIYGEVFHRKMQVEEIHGFSAHAGQGLLVEYALNLKGRVKEVFLVHGEERGADPLREILIERGMDKPHFPSRNTTFEI